MYNTSLVRELLEQILNAIQVVLTRFISLEVFLNL